MLDQDLPAIAQIRATTEFLSHINIYASVVKIDDQIAAKFGPRVSLLEAEIMRFVAAKQHCM